MSGLVVVEHGRVCMCTMAVALVILPAISAHGLVFETDSEQYDPGQPVVISGNVGVVLTGNQVAILIWNDAGKLVYIHQVSVDVEGEFAAVAELPPGDGWYTIQATYNKVQSEQMGFRVGQPAVPVEPDPVEPEEVEPGNSGCRRTAGTRYCHCCRTSRTRYPGSRFLDPACHSNNTRVVLCVACQITG